MKLEDASAAIEALDRLRARRAAQGVKVANAGKGKRREAELELYRGLDALVAGAEESLGVAGFPAATVVPSRAPIEDAADEDDLPF